MNIPKYFKLLEMEQRDPALLAVVQPHHARGNCGIFMDHTSGAELLHSTPQSFRVGTRTAGDNRPRMAWIAAGNEGFEAAHRMEMDVKMESAPLPEIGTDDTMKLFSDLLVVYLLVGSALGDCELYRRMGRALANNDAPRMRAALSEFNELSRPLKERILKGDPHYHAPTPLPRQPEETQPLQNLHQRAR